MKKKIIHIINLKGLGGVQKNFIEYYNNLKENNELDHYLFFIKNDKKNLIYKNILYLDNIKNIIFFLKLLLSQESIISIYNRIASFKLFLINILFFYKKIVVHERGSIYNIDSKRESIILKLNYYFASKVVTNSKATKNLLIKKFNLKLDKIHVVHNGFDVSNLGNIKNKNNKNNKIFVVGFCGRFEFHKNPYKMIEIAKLSSKDNTINYSLIGSGSLKDKIVQDSQKLSNIKILDSSYNLENFYNNIDILIVPSIREPFGNVIIEAGLKQIPVIASYIDGIPEIIKDQYNGLLVTPKINLDIRNTQKIKHFPIYVINPITQNLERPKEILAKDVYEKILYLKNNKKIIDNLSFNMIEEIKLNFSIENYIYKTDTIYKDL